jgi:hypothetical protein
MYLVAPEGCVESFQIVPRLGVGDATPQHRSISLGILCAKDPCHAYTSRLKENPYQYGTASIPPTTENSKYTKGMRSTKQRTSVVQEITKS